VYSSRCRAIARFQGAVARASIFSVAIWMVHRCVLECLRVFPHCGTGTYVSVSFNIGYPYDACTLTRRANDHLAWRRRCVRTPGPLNRRIHTPLCCTAGIRAHSTHVHVIEGVSEEGLRRCPLLQSSQVIESRAQAQVHTSRRGLEQWCTLGST